MNQEIFKLSFGGDDNLPENKRHGTVFRKYSIPLFSCMDWNRNDISAVSSSIRVEYAHFCPPKASFSGVVGVRRRRDLHETRKNTMLFFFNFLF